MAAPSTASARPRRAAPLAPPERRAAIVAATLPLLRRFGTAVTTRQIAEAAGVAEGTIFSVFADKDALLAEALQVALDPEPTRVRLAAIGARDGDFEGRLVAAVEIVQEHLAGIWQLLSAVGADPLPEGGRPERRKRGGVFVSKELAALFEAAGPELRLEPAAAAQALVGLTLAGTHPAVVGDTPLPASEIVSLLLDGIRSRPGPIDVTPASTPTTTGAPA